MDLAIDIGLSDMVHVDECQAPYTAASQGFNSPGAHPPHTDHDHMRGANALRTRYAVEPLQSTKPALRDLVRGHWQASHDS